MNLFKQTFPLTLISALRFFGLFIVMPTISVYALSLGATPAMVGLAVGGYALTQIIFQPPFGILGDKYDKRIVIAIGLIIFACGSLLCAMTEDIYYLIAGRMLQGAGAIASVISALIADLVKEEVRTKAMAIMGGGISISFLSSMLLGPLIGKNEIGGYHGVQILFFISALCAIGSIIILFLKVPKTPKMIYIYDKDSQPQSYLKDKNLWLMHISSFLQKALMVSGFVLIPLVLHQDFGYSLGDLWKFYTPAGIVGVFAMAPSSILAEKYSRYKAVMIAGIVAFGISFVLFAFSDKFTLLWAFIAGILAFFVGFNIHEPIMQSLTSKYPSASQRSSALGMFNTFGFLGSFIGAILSGVLYHKFGLLYLSIGVGIVCLVWIALLFALLDQPIITKTLFLPKEQYSSPSLQMQGIKDYYYTANLLVINYDCNQITEEQIKEALQ